MTAQVLHVIESMTPGGMETTFLNVLQSLKALDPHPDPALSHDVLSFTSGPLEHGYRAAARRLFLGSSRSSIESVLAEGYDVVHILFDRCAYRLAPILFSNSRSTVVYGKGYDISSMYRMNGGFEWRAEDSILAAADFVTFTTSQLASHFKLAGRDIEILGKAVDYSAFSLVPPVNDNTPDRILCISNLHPRKRLGDLIPVLQIIRRRVPTAEMVIAGGGNAQEMERLRQLAASSSLDDAFHLVGTRQDIPALIEHSRVIVLPSACEGVPTSLLEAMSAGRPVVTTDAGHVASIIEEGHEGFLVKVGDLESMADRITRILLDRRMAVSMGHAGHVRAANHDVPAIAAKLFALLQQASQLSAPHRKSFQFQSQFPSSEPPAHSASASDCFEVFQQIGSDDHVTVDDVTAADSVSGFRQKAWAAYTEHFNAFTGVHLDPLFHRIDNRRLPSGKLDEIGRPVLVVGTGPSLYRSVEDLRRIREHIFIFTSLRGADELERFGIVPDLIVVEHSSPLEAELTSRNLSIRSLEAVQGRTPWIACEERTPPDTIRNLNNGKLFIQESCHGWGFWPLTAVSMAIQGGAEKIGLLGIDLGSQGNPDPVFAPLRTVLGLVADCSSAKLQDCGGDGADKPGWEKCTLADFTEAPSSDLRSQATLEVRLRPRHASNHEERELLDKLEPLLEQARQGLTIALQSRDAQDGRSDSELKAWIETMLGWKHDPELRRALQSGLGLSFLPRFWRSGIAIEEGHLWRPIILAFSEILFQSEELKRKVGEFKSARKPIDYGRLPIEQGPRVLVMPVTYACNARCSMCTIWQRLPSKPPSFASFERVLANKSLGEHLEVVNLTGGEPFLRSDLTELIGIIVAACPRLREIGIPTNGSMPRRIVQNVRGIADALPAPAAVSVVVSIDGRPEVHDSLRGVDGLYTKAVHTLKALLQESKERKNLTVGINMTVSPVNAGEIPFLEELAKQLGTGLTLTPAVSSDLFINSKESPALSDADDSSWSEVAERLSDYAERCGTQSLADACRILKGGFRESACVFWNKGAFLDTNGDLYVCPVSKQGLFGNLRENYTEFPWRTPRHAAARDLLINNECRTCTSNCMASESDRSHVVRQIAASGRPIVVFGAGSGGRKVYRHLADSGLTVRAFVDNSVKDPSVSPYGIPVLPWDGGSHCCGAFTVIASATGGGEIARQLESAGFLHGRDYLSYF